MEGSAALVAAPGEARTGGGPGVDPQAHTPTPTHTPNATGCGENELHTDTAHSPAHTRLRPVHTRSTQHAIHTLPASAIPSSMSASHAARPPLPLHPPASCGYPHPSPSFACIHSTAASPPASPEAAQHPSCSRIRPRPSLSCSATAHSHLHTLSRPATSAPCLCLAPLSSPPPAVFPFAHARASPCSLYRLSRAGTFLSHP